MRPRGKNCSSNDAMQVFKSHIMEKERLQKKSHDLKNKKL